MKATLGTIRSWSDLPIGRGGMRLFQVAWTSDGDQKFTATTPMELMGWLHEMETVPDGDDVPTDNYDITLLNANGRDVAGAALANRSDTTVQMVKPIVNSIWQSAWIDGKLTITITTAGVATNGELLIYYQPTQNKEI